MIIIVAIGVISVRSNITVHTVQRVLIPGVPTLSLHQMLRLEYGRSFHRQLRSEKELNRLSNFHRLAQSLRVVFHRNVTGRCRSRLTFANPRHPDAYKPAPSTSGRSAPSTAERGLARRRFWPCASQTCDAARGCRACGLRPSNAELLILNRAFDRAAQILDVEMCINLRGELRVGVSH